MCRIVYENGQLEYSKDLYSNGQSRLILHYDEKGKEDSRKEYDRGGKLKG